MPPSRSPHASVPELRLGCYLYLAARLLPCGCSTASIQKEGTVADQFLLRRGQVAGPQAPGAEGLGPFGELHVGRGGYCGVAPLSETRCNATFVLDRAEFGACVGDLEAFYRAVQP